MVNHWSYRLCTFGRNDYGLHINNFFLQNTGKEVHNINMNGIIPVNPPPLHGSLPCKSLISRMDWVSCTGDINLPHTPFPPARSPPNKKNFFQFWGCLPSTFKIFRPWKKSSTIKSWPTFFDQYFWKFPIWNSCTWLSCYGLFGIKADQSIGLSSRMELINHKNAETYAITQRTSSKVTF